EDQVRHEAQRLQCRQLRGRRVEAAGGATAQHPSLLDIESGFEAPRRRWASAAVQIAGAPMRRWIGIVLGLMLCAAVAHAQQQPGRGQPKQPFATGEARFKAGAYRNAIAEFQAADALVPSPILAYNQALCYDRLGEVEPALRLYRDYLARRPDAPNKAEVE